MLDGHKDLLEHYKPLGKCIFFKNTKTGNKILLKEVLFIYLEGTQLDPISHKKITQLYRVIFMGTIIQ